jgi:diguanylate cyclase (GGDEF)-like protein
VNRNEAGKAEIPLALAIIDVDHFKSINDTYGHAVGDDILCGLGKHLESQIRPTDIAGRLGGEEFVIVWVGPSDLNPRAAAERLRQHIAESPLATRAEPLKITVSIGVVGVRQGDDLDRLLDRADLALYDSKAAGRNVVTVSEAAAQT